MAILVERDNIGIFGKMNSGKSSVMNLITQQETSIVDSTPGTTSDTKNSLFEIHGVGPVKLFDTAGADENSALGSKKRKKVFTDLKECDLVLLIIDPSAEDFRTEHTLIEEARAQDKQVLVLYNIFRPADEKRIDKIEKELPSLKFYRKLKVIAVDRAYRQKLLDFIIKNFDSRNKKVPLLPFLEKDEYYVLIIPMDEETPPGRYLRPQAMVEEYITRNWAYPVSFRMDLGKARDKNREISEKEYERFMSVINGLAKRPKAIITDSQAMDIMNGWCPDDIRLTTFSITMINYMSRGRLDNFVKGLDVMDKLEKGDSILIAEACNHSRIGEDIGTVQIPEYLKKAIPGIVIEHAFGRELREEKTLLNYRLVIHCGGCMISPQQVASRIRDLENIGVPFTNYGLFLAYMQGRKALSRVIEPWGLKIH
ncbi:50S ribosome-binding GTPase [bacterium]|jgi:GTP-binding protein EngB required for normal cell division|nr:50S ribosome-binding GTPase [bacterium]